MYQKEMRFKHQLKSELVALKQRIHSGKQEQKKQRQLDLERYTVLLPSPALPRSHATHTHTHTHLVPGCCNGIRTSSQSWRRNKTWSAFVQKSTLEALPLVGSVRVLWH